MFCSKCGTQIQNVGGVCSACGTNNAPQQPQQQQQQFTPPQQSYQAPPQHNIAANPATQAEIEAAESKSRASLAMGIISIVLCWLIGVPGIILGALAISNGKKARTVLDESHYFFWNALAGVITGSIGLALSIVSTIVWLVTFAGLSALLY